MANQMVSTNVRPSGGPAGVRAQPPRAVPKCSVIKPARNKPRCQVASAARVGAVASQCRR